MKRQRNDEESAILPGGESEGMVAEVMAMHQKKNKSVLESNEEGKKKNEERVGSMKKGKLLWWEECWPWMRGMTNEQMWWGYVWSPFWDFEFVDKACNPQFSDVVGDDDIWNLKRSVLN